MISQKVKVINASGIHARPAGILVKEAAKFKSKITIVTSEKSVPAKSIMFLMAAGIHCGTEIEVQCEGEDEEEALKAIIQLIESGLGE